MAFSRSGEFGILAAAQQGKPTCASDHGGHSSWLGASLGSLELVDRIVAYSAFGASLFRTPTPIAVIRGGVDAHAFAPPEPRPARDRVLFVGRLLPHKGVDRLIEALPAGLPLTVCGRPYDPDYLGLLRRLAAGKDVTFVTDADDAAIRDLYARAWCNVLPSVYTDCYGRRYRAPELMGLTLLEAMSCRGRAGRRAGSARCRSSSAEYQTGFTYRDARAVDRPAPPPGSSEPETVERIGRAARRRAIDAFDLLRRRVEAGAALRRPDRRPSRRGCGPHEDPRPERTCTPPRSSAATSWPAPRPSRPSGGGATRSAS